MPAGRSIAIDFGNTRTKVAYYDEQSGRSKLVEGLGRQTRAILPSLFYVDQGSPSRDSKSHQLIDVMTGDQAVSRRLHVGDDALNRRNADPSGFVNRLKLDLHNPRPLRLPRRGEKVDRVELASRLFAHIRHFCENSVFHGESLTRCSITVPADYETQRKEKIVEAARLAGFTEVGLLSEPESAARHWLQIKGGAQGNWVIVCDVGGGTSDFCLLGQDDQNFVRHPEMAPRAIERGGMHVDEEIWNNVLKERIFQTGEEADHWNSFRATFTTWIRENRENSNRSSAPPEMPISGAEAFKVEWNAIRSVETSFNDSIALELKTFVEQCSQKATRNENVPILLAGGGSQMPGLLDALDRATQGKVLIWNDSEYATALGAAVSSTSSLWSQASNHQQTTSPTSATSSEKPSDSEEGSNKPPPAPRQPQAQAPAPQAQAPAPQPPNIRKQQVAGAQEAPTTIVSRLAIASMVLGILWLWWIGSLLAVIFGHVSLSQCRKNPHMRGRGFAMAGVTLGWIGLVVGILIAAAVAANQNETPHQRNYPTANIMGSWKSGSGPDISLRSNGYYLKMNGRFWYAGAWILEDGHLRGWNPQTGVIILEARVISLTERSMVLRYPDGTRDDLDRYPP